MSKNKKKVSFVTGSSRGFGRHRTEAALERGDCVVATARKREWLSDLAKAYPDTALVLPLDVTDRDAVFAAVAQAQTFRRTGCGRQQRRVQPVRCRRRGLRSGGA